MFSNLFNFQHKKDGGSGNPDEDPAASGSTSTSGMKSKLGLLDKKKDKKDKNKKVTSWLSIIV